MILRSAKLGMPLVLLMMFGWFSVPPLVVAGEVERVLFEENFQEKLGDGWSWLYEDPAAWRIEGGKLQIQPTGGSPWEGSRDGKNYLLRKPPEPQAGDLAVEVLVEHRPTQPFEHAGIMWYYDDDNYVTLNKESFGGKQVALFVVEKDGKGQPPYGEIPYQDEAIWLRLRVSAKTITGQFRASTKEEWRTAGSRALQFQGKPSIVMHAGYGPKNDKDRRVSLSRFKILRIVNE
jgi:regulation of enolase protein 1 (concanavalin A-like superfamily)